MASAEPLTPKQLNLARTALWHQNGDALRTADSTREWLETAGLVPYYPHAQFAAAPQPSFAEAVLGRPEQGWVPNAPSAANAAVQDDADLDHQADSDDDLDEDEEADEDDFEDEDESDEDAEDSDEDEEDFEDEEDSDDDEASEDEDDSDDEEDDSDEEGESDDVDELPIQRSCCPTTTSLPRTKVTKSPRSTASTPATIPCPTT